MKIGALSRRTGISERMLRYYEQQGLLSPARTASGYRDYGDAEIRTAARIRTLSVSGLKIDTIRTLLPCMRDERQDFEPCDEVHASLRREMQRIDQKLSALRESRRVIRRYLAGLAPLSASAPAERRTSRRSSL